VGTRAATTAIVVTLVIAGCTATATSDTAAPSDSSVTPAATVSDERSASPSATAAAVDHVAMLKEQLDDPEFSVRFDITGREQQPAGTTRRTGAGAVVGDDSELWVVDDLSGLEGAHSLAGQAAGVIGPGAVIGSDATTALVHASKIVDGTLYSMDNRGHWHESDATDPNTVPGYVFGVLREVDSFEVTGSGSSVDAGHVTLRPTTAVDYDLADLALSPVLADDADVDTRVVVDDGGALVRVEVEVDAPSHDYTWSVAYDVRGVGDLTSIEPPDDTWVSASSLGFGTLRFTEPADGIILGAEGEALVDFELPVSWEPVWNPEGVLSAQPPPGQTIVVLQSGWLDEDVVNLEREVAGWASAVDIELNEMTHTDIGGFPSVRGLGTHAQGMGMVHAQTVGSGRNLFTAVMLSSSPNADAHVARLTEVLQTLERRPQRQGPSPGGSIADDELQRDTMESVAAVAVVAAGDGCEAAEVLWTEVTGSRPGEWTEDWLVDACGDLQIHEVTFVEAAQGGTDIAVPTSPFRFADASVPRRHDEIEQDPAVAAALLLEQPWLIAPGLDVDEIDVASSVQASQFHGSRLRVLILASPLGDRFEDYFDTVFNELGSGTLLLIDGDDRVRARTHVDAYMDTIVTATDAAGERGTSVEGMIEEFVTALDPDVGR
jgi:hypothetical protein